MIGFTKTICRPLRAGMALIFCTSMFACTSISPLSDDASGNAWILVDNFEAQESLDGWTVLDTQNDTDPFVPNPQITEIRQEATRQNGFLIRKPADEGIVGNRKALAWKTLPEEIAVGSTATIFTRINVEYFPNNHSFGLSNATAEEIAQLSYDAFEPMLRVTDKAESDGSQNDGTLMVLMGHKKYSKIFNAETGEVAKPLEPGEWYDIWYIVDNKVKSDGGQKYKVYIRGGEFKGQTLVFDGATFRIGREKALTQFIAICNTGPKKSPYGNGGVRYDDIYMAAGEELSSPLD